MKRTYLIGGLIGLLVWAWIVGLGHADQFCGFAVVATPQAPMIISGTAHASMSVANTIASGWTNGVAGSGVPAIPSLRLGRVVGAIITVEQTAIRVRHDGSVPAGTFDGTLWPAGSTLQVCGSDLLNFQAIASSSGSNAVLHLDFYTNGG